MIDSDLVPSEQRLPYTLHLRTAKSLSTQNNTSEAKIELKKAINLVPECYEAYHLLAMLHYQTNVPDQAIELCQHFVRSHPGHVESSNDLATLLNDTGDHRQAIDLYHSVLQTDPPDSRIQCNLATALLDNGDTEKAFELFKNILKKGVSDQRAQFLIGIEGEYADEHSTTDKFTVGQSLLVLRRTLFSNGVKEQEFRSRIEDVSKDQIDIALPTRGYTTFLLQKGSKVILGFPGKNEFWGIVVTVLGIKLGNIPTLSVTNPLAFKRVQRRAHVRVPCSQVLSSITLTKEKKKLPLNLDDIRDVDISAKGMGLLSRKTYSIGSSILLSLNINSQQYSIESKIVRIIPHENDYHIGVVFLNLNEKQTDLFARMIQQLQIEQRRRERDSL